MSPDVINRRRGADVVVSAELPEDLKHGRWPHACGIWSMSSRGSRNGPRDTG
jgi:hypothetical protein